jgi:hypothetical protein
LPHQPHRRCDGCALRRNPSQIAVGPYSRLLPERGSSEKS